MLVLLSISFVNSLLLPIPLESPHPINSHELICHYGLPVNDQSYGTRYDIRAIVPAQTSHEIKGFLCSKTIWEFVCNEGFFGGETHSYIIHKAAVSDRECLDAYKKVQNGEELHIPHFPPDYCSWMAENSKSETYITLTQHNVYLDPYKNSYVDLIFLNHRCNQMICQTHYDNIKWITEKTDQKTCTEWYSVNGEMTLDDNKNLNWSYIEAEFIPKTPLSQICSGISYCGVVGYVLPNGLFFSITNPSVFFNVERDVLVKRCLPNTEISSHPLSSSIASAELETLEILFNTKCNDVVSKIRNGQNVTVYELGFLHPTYPGIGYSFINIKGRLYSAKSRFEPLDKYEIIHDKEPSLQFKDKGNNLRSILIQNCTWLSVSNGSSLCRWYNGLLIAQDEVIPPYSTREELKVEMDIYSEIQPKFDHHIVLPDLTNDTINTSDQTDDPDYMNSDVIGSVTKWVGKWFHYLGFAITFIIIGVILYCCWPCIGPCLICCCNPSGILTSLINSDRNHTSTVNSIPLGGRIQTQNHSEFVF